MSLLTVIYSPQENVQHNETQNRCPWGTQQNRKGAHSLLHSKDECNFPAFYQEQLLIYLRSRVSLKAHALQRPHDNLLMFIPAAAVILYVLYELQFPGTYIGPAYPPISHVISEGGAEQILARSVSRVHSSGCMAVRLREIIAVILDSDQSRALLVSEGGV